MQRLITFSIGKRRHGTGRPLPEPLVPFFGNLLSINSYIFRGADADPAGRPRPQRT